jgi:5-hydroxyisourate hydrolase
MAGKLTTHVLNTAQGCPGVGIPIELWLIQATTRSIIKALITNADGRTNEPLLAETTMPTIQEGTYELVFKVGAYFAQQAIVLPDPPFLDIIPIRFAIADVNQHYHVPLLVSPWSYSTYRGS